MSNEELSLGLMDELAAAERGLRRMQIGGSVMVLFLITYLQFMHSQFTAMAEPKGLADIGVLMLEEHATEVVSSVEAGLTEEAPSHVQTFYKGLAEGSTVVRVSLLDHIRAADSALARQMEAWLGDYFDTLVKENPQMQLILEKKQEVSKEAFAGLGDQIRGDLEVMFEASGLDKELGEASAMISGFADRLDRFNRGSGLGSDEKEERALLHAWVNLVAPDYVAPKEELELR